MQRAVCILKINRYLRVSLFRTLIVNCFFLISNIENRNVNNPLLFEGDMLISNYQKQIALAGEDVAMATGRKRGATTWGTWPNGKIPYTIDSAVSGKL